MRQMVPPGDAIQMTVDQLMAAFDRKDAYPSTREEVADELYEIGLVTRPALRDAPRGSTSVVISESHRPLADHMLRNGLIWAVLIPLVGAVLAIRLFARERVGQGFAVLATAILVVLVYLYAFGTFDRPLSRVGLNVHECARNGLDQTFCGKELTEARERAAAIKREGDEAQERSEEEAAKLKRESEEEDAKLKREEEAAEASAHEEEAKIDQQIQREAEQVSE